MADSAKYIALLRGINVGGHKKMAMPALKAMFEGLGCENVLTYIQSGNVIFDAAGKDWATLIAAQIAEVFGFEVQVLVLTVADFEAIYRYAQNLFEEKDVKKAVVSFLQNAPSEAQIAALRAVESGADTWEVAGKALYLYCPDGYGQTKLANHLIENKLKTVATTRNWNTVQALMNHCL